MNMRETAGGAREIPAHTGDASLHDVCARERQGGPASFPPDSLSWVRAFFHSRAATPEDAEDLSQEVFLQACRQWLSFDRRCSLRTWLFSIARHVLADYYRRRRRRQLLWQSFSGGNGDGITGFDRHSPAGITSVETRDLLAHCMTCLETRLTLPQQVAELLGDVLGYRDREAARLMHCSLPRYKHLLHDARTHLRRLSGDACPLVGKTGPEAVCRQPPPPSAMPQPAPAGPQPAPAGRKDAAKPLRQLERQLRDGLLNNILPG